MISKRFLLNSQVGLHARPASKLVSVASGFESNIKIATNDHEANLKSILGVLGLAASYDEIITITFDGTDEMKASEKITETICFEHIGKEC